MDRVIIIAEACQNHNGQLKMAYKLVDVAKKCGADFVNFKPLYQNCIFLNLPKKQVIKLKIGKKEGANYKCYKSFL